MSNLVDIQDLMSEKSENISFKKVEKDPYEGTGLKGLLVLKKIAQIEAILGGIVLLFATPIFLSDLFSDRWHDISVSFSIFVLGLMLVINGLTILPFIKCFTTI